MKTRIPLLFVLLASAMAKVCARDFYVSPGGNDGAIGSLEQPWKTVQHAADSLSPGDTAHVLAGEYFEKIDLRVSGSKEQGPVSVKAEDAAILSGKGVKGENIIHIANHSFVRIEGFEIRDNLKVKDGSGIRVEGACEHVELVRNRIHDIRGKDAMGITVYGNNAQKPVSELLIEGNEIYDCEPAKSETLTLNGNVSDFKILNNTVRDVNNIGICMIGGEAWINKDRSKVARNGLCKGNKVIRARSSDEGGFAAGIYVDGGTGIVIEDNDITGSNLGIEIGAENRGVIVRDVTVRNNRVWHNEKAGIVFGGYDAKRGVVIGCRFENNLCFRNDRHKNRMGEIWIQRATDCVVSGNVCWCGNTGVLVNSDKLAEGNRLSANRYFSDEGEAAANFIWRGREIDGFAGYLRASGQDVDSVFKKPDWREPAKGDFSKP